jgi:serine/threonine protein kinase
MGATDCSEVIVEHRPNLIGRYEILRELGRGAMGIVYSAIDPLIHRHVAIKTIRLDTLGDDAARLEVTGRLLREAQSAGILSHPGIITIYDLGEEGANAYIVMEFVIGDTLEALLASRVPQHSDVLISFLKQCAIALDFAHSKGIIHRDIKPSNIMICNNGTVKIADFGVAKMAASHSVTLPGFVIGTPSYMSPEQVQGIAIDGRSDQFSLAVVAYRALTGKLPFEGPTLTALLAKILLEEPNYEITSLPPALRPAIQRALSKNPQLRFPSCVEFVQELESACTWRNSRKPIPSLSEKGAAPAELNVVPHDLGFANAYQAADAESGPDTDFDLQSVESTPEVAAAGKRGKSFLIASGVGLGLVVLAALLWVVKVELQPKELPESALFRARSASLTGAVKPEGPKPGSDRPVDPTSKITPAREASPKAPGQPVSPITRKVQVITGMITWSGQLEKNSVLVIGPDGPSIGRVTGDALPGEPVLVEVEPNDVQIRQAPNEENNWTLIILYSGKSKYSSITVRWQTKS